VIAAAEGIVARIVSGSHLKYLGLTLVLAWHYCLWFAQGSFPTTFLLDDRITFAWLIALASTGLTVTVLAILLGRTRHLPQRAVFGWAVCLTGGASTAVLTMVPVSAALDYVVSAVIGGSAGLLWVMWGERYARQRAKFTITRLAPTYGVTLLIGLAWAYLMPGYLPPVLVCLLPIASGVLWQASWRHAPVQAFPPVLPARLARQGYLCIATVSLISFVTVYISYFVVAIVPWTDLWGIERSFVLGVALGAVFVLALAAAHRVSPSRSTVFRLFPWLVFLIVIACLLCALGIRLDFVAFLLALAVSSLFELLFILYMARLTLSGYIPAAVAFGLSAATIRLGIALGNGTALIYERVPGLLDHWTTPTLMVFAAILAGLLIPLVRQEYTINDLARSPQDSSEWERIVVRTAEEFRLSSREQEIMGLLGRGYSGASIAEKTCHFPPHRQQSRPTHLRQNGHPQALGTARLPEQALKGGAVDSLDSAADDPCMTLRYTGRHERGAECATAGGR